MPKRNSKALPVDVNEAAHLLVERSLEKLEAQSERLPVSRAVHRIMSKMGSKGGRIGGKRRLDTMSSEERSRVASIAAKTRWAKARHKD
jgi:hypothetical protein